jgi:plasmid stabilization system protein ParE
MKVIYSPLAARELVRESKKYERIADDLGELFISDVEAATDRLATFPESGPVLHGRFRRWVLKRFPFAILYSVSTAEIRVVAIMHQHRGPEFMARRLKQEPEGNDA